MNAMNASDIISLVVLGITLICSAAGGAWILAAHIRSSFSRVHDRFDELNHKMSGYDVRISLLEEKHDNLRVDFDEHRHKGHACSNGVAVVCGKDQDHG